MCSRRDCYIVEAVESLCILESFGDDAIHVGRIPRIVRLPGVRHLFVYALPFPRNAPTARELLTTTPGSWDADVTTFTSLVNELARRADDSATRWPEHPFFGPLTRKDWGVLGYRHSDHHLRQFGA